MIAQSGTVANGPYVGQQYSLSGERCPFPRWFRVRLYRSGMVAAVRDVRESDLSKLWRVNDERHDRT